MTNQELIQAAKVIRDICRSISPRDCPMCSVKNEKCPFAVKYKNEGYGCVFYEGTPEYWVFKGEERESK